MKKRNKKYTPKPLPARMYSWESDRGIEDRYVNAQLKLGFKWVQVAGEAAFSVVNQRRNWTLILRVILWYADGTVDYNSAMRPFKNVNLNELEEESKAMRAEIIKTAKMEHIVDIGWIAETFNSVPRETGLDMFQIGDITEERQMLWNYSWSEEIKSIVA